MAKATTYSSFQTKAHKKANVFGLIGKGVLLSIVISLCCMILLSLLELTTDNEAVEKYMNYILVGITLLSIFIGSVYATKQAESLGLLIGIMVGLIYVLISLGLGINISQDSISMFMLVNKLMAGFAAGALGGLVGVKLS